MEVEYRQLFLKDLKKLKKQPIYDQIVDIAFERLPLAGLFHSKNALEYV